ncbi:hypothetical protein LOTGIDRAFT_230595 [Lottia gigantea]|uniref:GTP:AMP phosphotransferase, mitochondrial n=1 Tax=Lottia gigantea TaxID=225164 RepID=V4B1L5_LOTGI|nr:hypothetical protein LOTGIDRAFT_230595 [Lottia gigantea]ESP01206.1 hypothetical protein LOTGIDRAFT_230595 [Lottia gigantea]
MLSKVLKTIIIGPPGAGKGTISTRIVKDFGMKHLSSGDILRKHIMEGTATGLAAKHHIDKGELVPDRVMVDIFITELRHLHNHSWLLDGFPRTVKQAEALHRVEPVDLVINLKVPFEVIMERISNRWTHISSGRIYHSEFNPPKVTGKDDVTGEDLIQRDDDKPETVRQRLQTFQNMTEKVLDFYRERDLLTEFQGSESNEIWPRVHKFLSTIKTPLHYTEYK